MAQADIISSHLAEYQQALEHHEGQARQHAEAADRHRDQAKDHMHQANAINGAIQGLERLQSELHAHDEAAQAKEKALAKERERYAERERLLGEVLPATNEERGRRQEWPVLAPDQEFIPDQE